MFPYHRHAVFVPFLSVFRDLLPHSVHGHNESSTLVYFVPRSLHFRFSTGFFHIHYGWLQRSRTRVSQLCHNCLFLLKFIFLIWFQHPYPSEDQKKQLAQDTGLTILQVNNWWV